MQTPAVENDEGDPTSLVLVVDDEPSICWALERMLTQEGHRVAIASSAEAGLTLAAELQPSLVMLDVRLPKQDGISALPEFLQVTGNAPVIVMTAFGDLETAVAAVKHGASDYLTKPFRLEDAIRMCRQALHKSVTRTAPVATNVMSRGNETLVGQSAGMQQVFRQIALVADSDLSVLITGETGTGKELVAAAIHRHSRRANQTYIPIAPVALHPELIESELFGHVKGAFTGASDDRPGLFERAAGGTVFLDEIGDLPLSTQVKLLRVLEQGQYCPVGDVRVQTSDVRVLAATHRDLHEAVALGEFREDLFHRLSGVQIHLPPLRNRIDDIATLCQHFLGAMDYQSRDSAIDAKLLATLGERPWNGNIRELKNAIEHAAVVARGRQLRIEDFPDAKPGRISQPASTTASLERSVRAWATEAVEKGEVNSEPLHSQFLTAAEPALLQVVMESTGGNRAKAAELLGIHRGTLRDRLRAYGMDDAK